MSFNFMTKMKIAKVGLRSRRGKLLTYSKRHIVLVLGVAGFFVILTSQLRLIFTSSAQYYGDRRSLSLTSSLIHLANEQNSTSITITTITRDDILLSVRPPKPVTIAYAISLIKCGNFQSSAAGMTDAALVLRHSIHQSSARNTDAHSHYDYKMYAIVHSQAVECSHLLRDAGFEIIIKDAPVQPKEIQGEFLRKNIRHDGCCGHDEFIKLYAYTLPEPIAVHMDIDFVFHQPMDDVFDALLYDKGSAIGKAARERIPRERPTDAWPDRPQAMMTRDWPQVVPEPGRRVGYQAGFLVARTNPAVTDELIEIIRQGHYVGTKNATQIGWGGLGYGGFLGAMAMQGLLAYYYDIQAPDTWVELNQCRFNHMGMNVLYQSPPNFKPGHVNRGKCRNNRNECEDCMHTELDSIYNIHFTQCRKPWNCIGEGTSLLPRAKRLKPRTKTAAEKLLIPEDSVHLEHCMQLQTIWHGHRRDLESKLKAWLMTQEGKAGGANQSETTPATTTAINAGLEGDYKKEIFQGHCKGNGPDQYLLFSSGNADFIKQIPELYVELR